MNWFSIVQKKKTPFNAILEAAIFLDILYFAAKVTSYSTYATGDSDTFLGRDVIGHAREKTFTRKLEF